MPRAAWMTDIHLNFLDDDGVGVFLDEVDEATPDLLLLGGDIAEAPTLTGHLAGIARRIDRPIYFVLGNHDYYGGWITGTREAVVALCRREPRLRWLPEAGVVELTSSTALVGHGCWGDGRCGDAERSDVLLNDYFLIEDLRDLSNAAHFRRLRALGDEAAGFLRRTLPVALDQHPRVLVLTHCPPFPEAAWHRGRMSEPDYLPFFACRAAGDALCEVMLARPDHEMTVFCGHTHGAGRVRILPNLEVITAGAEYGRPEIAEILDIA